MRQAGKFFPAVGAGGVIQRQGHHRHIINAPGLNDRLGGAEILWQPVLVRIHLVVQANQGILAGNAHLELHGDHRLALTGHGIHVLHALDFAHYLLGRCGNGAFNLPGAGPWHGHHDVRHGDINLGLFLLGCHHDRQDTKNNRQDRQQRRQVVVLEYPGNGSGRADRRQVITHGLYSPSARAFSDRLRRSLPTRVSGLVTTRSPSESPASTSSRSFSRAPRRTWRRRGLSWLSSTNTARSSLRSIRALAGTHRASRLATGTLTFTSMPGNRLPLGSFRRSRRRKVWVSGLA